MNRFMIHVDMIVIIKKIQLNGDINFIDIFYLFFIHFIGFY